jgi:hypothetical protein
MKETYKSPELELLCLAPAERIANNENIDFDSIKDPSFGGSSYTIGDTEIDLPLK